MATATVAHAEPMRIESTALDLHRAKMDARREERKKHLSEQIRCLDAEHAANAEAAKPKHRFAITCTVQERDERLKRMMPVQKSGEVDARNEDDAWAIFCDKWKVRTGPNFCNREIKKLRRGND